jgi:hypothetical protein
MPNKKITIIDKADDDNDKLDQVINNLNNIAKGDNNDDKIEKQPTVLDEYLEILRLKRQMAYQIYKNYVMRLISNGADSAEIEKAMGYVAMFLGVNDRWSNEVLKTAINNEMNMYGGYVAKLLPEYIGDPVANFERSQAIGVKDDTSMLLSSLLQLLGINLSPEMIDKIMKLLKERTGEKTG